MNIDEMKKDVGRALHLRPLPQLVESYGTQVSVLTSAEPRYHKDVLAADYDWIVEAVNDKAKTVTLFCRTPHFLMLKCQLILEGDQASSRRSGRPAMRPAQRRASARKAARARARARWSNRKST